MIDISLVIILILAVFGAAFGFVSGCVRATILNGGGVRLVFYFICCSD